MNILTPQILADLWRLYRESQTPSDPDLAAFHVLSQAMQHEFLIAAEAGNELDLAAFYGRAEDYCRQATEQLGAG